MNRIIYRDCLEHLRNTTQHWDCIFADPPDNLGLSYHSYIDKVPHYYDWLDLLIREAINRTPVFWLSYYHKHDLEIKFRLRRILKLHPREWKQFIWYYSFGEYNEHDATNCHRIILRISGYSWNPVLEERIPTVREQMNDRRATGIGKIPGDVWAFPRIQGNNHERRAWHPTQHPEAIYSRISRMSGGKSFLDLFGGTGTALRAIRDKDVTVIEIDEKYCQEIAKEHGLRVEEF